MSELAKVISHVLETEKLHGKYSGLFLLALLFLWMIPKDLSGRRGKKLALFALVQTGFVLCVPLLFFFQKTLGFGENFWEYLWTVPVLTVIAYTVVEVSAVQKNRQIFWGAALVCLVTIALSGTLLPFKSDVEKKRYASPEVGQVLSMVQSQEEYFGGKVLLLAPDEILEQARAVDGNIHLLYGRDMWESGANTAVADEYGQDLKLLYEKMQRDFEEPDDIADLAKWYCCDVLVLRERLTGGSRQATEWELVGETDGYEVYRYLQNP